MADQNDQSTLLGKIAAYTEILVKDPNSTIFVSLAETYRKMGMLEDARHIIEKGLELHPDFGPGHIVLARVQCQQEDFSASVDSFERALNFDPDSLAALVGYARVALLLDDKKKGRELLLRARDLSPADPVINKLLLSLPEEESSSDHADELRAEESSDPLISVTLAELYLKQGLMDEALNAYKELSANAPDDLSLRRKIKELEGSIGDADGSDCASEDGVDYVSQDSVSAEEQEEITSDVNQQEGESNADTDDPAADDPRSPEERVLSALNQWLETIQKRREHV